MQTIVIGNSEYAVMLMDYLEEDGIKVDAFCVDERYIVKEKICGKSVISIEKVKEIVSPDMCELYLGIGYSKVGLVKKSIFERFKYS